MGTSSSILQALRGLTAVGVVLCHLHVMLDPAGIASIVFGHFDLGVDVFFIISGFVIAISTAEVRSATPASFVLRRIFRVLPLAWVTLLLMILIIHADWGLVLRGFLMLPENPYFDKMPLNYPQWTLSYELFFYALFATSLAISHRFRCEICLALIAALSIADICLPSSGGAVRSFFRAELFLEFGAGIVLAKMIMSAPRPLPKAWALSAGTLAMAAGVAICAMRPLRGGFFDFGGGAAMVLAGLLFVETYVAVKIPRWLHGLGDLSYAIYITQAFVFLYVDSTVFWTPLHKTWIYQNTAGASRVVLVLAVSLAISALLHVVIEKPGFRLGKRLAKSLRGRAPVPLEAEPQSG